MSDEETEEIVTSWSSVLVTFVISAAQGLIFYAFFLHQRAKEKAKQSFDLYEPRQHNLSHRSPPPYSPEKSWWREAWDLSQEETLRCVGLDSFMFLRFLRLGARICLVGSALACVLIPVYATGEARGEKTEQFNQLTLARVEAQSDRLWAPLIAWYIFVAFCIREMLLEWSLYTKNRNDFMARGGEWVLILIVVVLVDCGGCCCCCCCFWPWYCEFHARSLTHMRAHIHIAQLNAQTQTFRSNTGTPFEWKKSLPT